MKSPYSLSTIIIFVNIFLSSILSLSSAVTHADTNMNWLAARKIDFGPEINRIRENYSAFFADDLVTTPSGRHYAIFNEHTPNGSEIRTVSVAYDDKGNLVYQGDWKSTYESQRKSVYIPGYVSLELFGQTENFSGFRTQTEQDRISAEDIGTPCSNEPWFAPTIFSNGIGEYPVAVAVNKRGIKFWVISLLSQR